MKVAQKDMTSMAKVFEIATGIDNKNPDVQLAIIQEQPEVGLPMLEPPVGRLSGASREVPKGRLTAFIAGLCSQCRNTPLQDMRLGVYAVEAEAEQDGGDMGQI